MKAVRVEKASFAYETAAVFEDITFSIERGEIFCLFGPNGCGKTTLLNTILGTLKLDAGEVFIEDRKVSGLPPREAARLMAYVPQVHEKTFPYSVEEIVLMGRTPYTDFFSSPGREDHAIVHEALRETGILHLKERIYTTLSGGETQLVMLARALAQEAPLIIMDEPASHLDFRNEISLLETIRNLVREKGLTVIVTTHSPNHAFYFENNGLPVSIAVMHQHGITASGPPSEVLTEEMMRRVFDVESRLFEHRQKEKTPMRYILPLGTR